jgi:hypothetical protein
MMGGAGLSVAGTIPAYPTDTSFFQKEMKFALNFF